MAEHRLTPLPALGHLLPLQERIGPVLILEAADMALASLAARRGQEEALAARAAAAGIRLPGPGRWEAGLEWAALWAGPSLWFVEAPLATREDIVAHLKPLVGEAASVTEQTDAWVRLEVQGPLEPLFERLCNLDLAGFGPGSGTRTVIEHLGVHALRRAPDRMTLLSPRSSAGSLLHALRAAARSAF